jgi:hypothetical protein
MNAVRAMDPVGGQPGIRVDSSHFRSEETPDICQITHIEAGKTIN